MTDNLQQMPTLDEWREHKNNLDVPSEESIPKPISTDNLPTMKEYIESKGGTVPSFQTSLQRSSVSSFTGDEPDETRTPCRVVYEIQS